MPSARSSGNGSAAGEKCCSSIPFGMTRHSKSGKYGASDPTQASDTTTWACSFENDQRISGASASRPMPPENTEW